jgi:phosphotransferase system HPr-like phosphotransfer protein
LALRSFASTSIQQRAMTIDTTLIGTALLGILALAALAVAWGRPVRIRAEAAERMAALERLERECEQRAAWTNPHARPRGLGEPVGERRLGDYPRLRLVDNGSGDHAGGARPAS